MSEFDYNFRLFQGADRQWYITIEHVNGQAVYTSEGYVRKESALASLEHFVAAVQKVSVADAPARLLVAKRIVVQ